MPNQQTLQPEVRREWDWEDGVDTVCCFSSLFYENGGKRKEGRKDRRKKGNCNNHKFS